MPGPVFNTVPRWFTPAREKTRRSHARWESEEQAKVSARVVASAWVTVGGEAVPMARRAAWVGRGTGGDTEDCDGGDWAGVRGGFDFDFGLGSRRSVI